MIPHLQDAEEAPAAQEAAAAVAADEALAREPAEPVDTDTASYTAVEQRVSVHVASIRGLIRQEPGMQAQVQCTCCKSSSVKQPHPRGANTVIGRFIQTQNATAVVCCCLLLSAVHAAESLLNIMC